MGKIASGKLGAIEIFCRAAEALNFSTAASGTGTTPSAVSKAVRRLEDQVGVRLFDRTTRAIRLTPEGASYYASCMEALEKIQRAEAGLTQNRERPRGTLAISMPPSFGIVDFIPRLRTYLERYPQDFRMRARLTNSISAFVRDEVDVAIRIGKVPDSRVVAVHLFDSQAKVVASPAYLARRGIPRRPEDLGAHSCIELLLPDTSRPVPWEFKRGSRKFRIAVPSVLSLDHPLAVVSAAVAGCGLARLLDFSVAQEIAAGHLVEVLGAFHSPPTPVSIVYPSRRHISAKVRSFVDFAVASYLRHDGSKPY
jgi:DNA-binding transcriptional LysR family regulator